MNIQEYDENVSAPLTQGATITLYSFQVPSRATMILTHFSNYLNLIGQWGRVTWRILRNGAAIPPYNQIMDQLGLSTEPRKIAPQVFYGGDSFTVQVIDDNVTGQPPAQYVGCAIKFEVRG